MEFNDEYPTDSFVEDESQKETEDDLPELTDEAIRQVVISGTDWTTETIISQINKGNILLNPIFQRRDAWTKKRKSKFIESLFLGLPVPQLVFAQSKDQRGKYLVLDGKQRLLSIRQFAALKNDKIYNQLKLIGLEIRSDLNNKSLSDIQKDIGLYEDLSTFENQPIRTVIIKNWPNDTFLYHVFHRLNTGSVSLSPQELRQALKPGQFVAFVDECSQDSKALRDIFNNPKPDFRMRDAELLVRYYAFSYFLKDYSGNLKAFLDETCDRLNKEWILSEEQIKIDMQEFENAHWAIRDIFKENAYRKWTGTFFERRFNRAIFDIFIYVFRISNNRNILKDHPTKVIDIFKELCETDYDFLSSIEKTTKSISATHTRLSTWCDHLNSSFNLKIKIPNFYGFGLIK